MFLSKKSNLDLMQPFTLAYSQYQCWRPWQLWYGMSKVKARLGSAGIIEYNDYTTA
jgi:hypothetical protein